MIARTFLAAVIFVLSLLYGAVDCAAQGSEAKPVAEQQQLSVSESSEFQIAPGLRFPDKGVVWVLDGAPEKPEAVRVFHNNAKLDRHTGANIVGGLLIGPLNKCKSTVVLPGVAAKVRVRSHSPVIFVRRTAEEEEMESSANGKAVPRHLALLKMRVDGGHRLVNTFSTWVGKTSRHEDLADVSTEEVAGGSWVKLIPRAPLPDGEYAVVQLPDDKKLFKSVIYDFGIGAAPQPLAKAKGR